MLKSKEPKQGSLLDAHPIHLVEGDKLVLKDGRVAVGFQLEPAEMERWSQQDFKAAHSSLQQALKVLPAGAIFQKTDVYYDRPYQHPLVAGKVFDQFLGSHFAGRPVLFHQSYVFLSFAPVPARVSEHAVKKSKGLRFANALNAAINRIDQVLPPTIFDNVQATLPVAEKHTAEFVEAVTGISGIQLSRLGGPAMEQLYRQFLSMEFDEPVQQLDKEMLNLPGTLAIGEQHVSAVSMVGQGTETHPCVTNHYNVVAPMAYPVTQYLQVPHIFTQAIRVLDTREALQALDLDRKLNKAVDRIATQDTLLRIAEIETLTAEVRAEGKALCDLHVSLITWASDDDKRKQYLEAAKAALRAIYHSQVAVEAHNNMLVFFGALPGNAGQLPERWIPTTADRATCYVPWITTYRPTPTGEYICDRFANLVRINLFDAAGDNQNYLVIGPSGTGKSFTMGNFLMQRHENGARQLIIDVGGSYKSIVRSIAGDKFEECYFTYDPANPIAFNPFFLPRDPATGQWQYGDEKRIFHLALLATIWKHGALSKGESAILGRFLRDFYRSLNEAPTLGRPGEVFPRMDAFYDFVLRTHDQLDPERPLTEAERHDEALGKARAQYAKDSKFFAMDEFLLILREYTGSERYGQVLNAQRDVDLSDHPLICFDMESIKRDVVLYPVVALLITELSLDLFRKYPHEVKYILMDEAWSMISGALSGFVENMYRTIRKLNGSVGIITQGIGEILKSEIGYTLINNSYTKIILRHDDENTRQSLAGPLGFTSHDMALIASMRVGANYREFFIKQGKVSKVYLLEASPELYALATSKPAERNYLNSLFERYQRHVPELMLDDYGRPVLVGGLPQFRTRIENRLDFAVQEYLATAGEHLAAAPADSHPQAA